MKPVLESEESGVKELLQLPTAEEMGSVSELLCQLSVWLLRFLPKVLMVREHFLGKGRKPRAKFSRVVDYCDALVLKIQGRCSFRNYQTVFHLKCSQWLRQFSSLKYRPLYMTAAWLSRGAWWSQRYFNKIHAHHTGVGCVPAFWHWYLKALNFVFCKTGINPFLFH